jgi:hypothetical protein
MRKKRHIISNIQDTKHELLKQHPMEHLAIATSVDLAERSEKKKKPKMRHKAY